MEAEEISEFSKEMREAGESSMTHVSLIISVLAVLVAMLAVLGHREHTEAVLLQSRTADQWEQYQSRRIRQEQVTVASDLLALQPANNLAAQQAKLAEYKEHLAHWGEQLREDQSKAHDLQAEVDRSERKAGRFDLGEALLQISVVLASVTLLTRQSRYVGVALVLACAGVAVAISAVLVR